MVNFDATVIWEDLLKDVNEVIAQKVGFDRSISEFQAKTLERGLDARLDEVEYSQIFSPLVNQATTFAGQPNDVVVTVARSNPDWVAALGPRFVTLMPQSLDEGFRSAYLCILTKLATGHYDVPELEMMFHVDPVATIPALTSFLLEDLHFAYIIQGAALGRTVSVNLPGIQTLAYITARTHPWENLTKTLQAIYIGQLKHLSAHETSHVVLGNIEQTMTDRRVSRSSEIALARQISGLDQQLAVHEKMPFESYVLALFNYVTGPLLHNVLSARLQNRPIDRRDFDLLPKKLVASAVEYINLREAEMAKYAIEEGVAEFVVHKLLKKDEDYKTFKRLDPKPKKAVDPHYLSERGQVVVEYAYERFGREAFRLLATTPPLTLQEVMNPKQYFAKLGQKPV